jgi:hypothetical protein
LQPAAQGWGEDELLRGLRVAFLVAAALLLVILPVGEVTVLLALFVAVDLAAAALLLQRSETPQSHPVVPLDGDAAKLALLRRTVPALRMRRPPATVEAQVLWRHAAEKHRQRREVAWSKLR